MRELTRRARAWAPQPLAGRPDEATMQPVAATKPDIIAGEHALELELRLTPAGVASIGRPI